MKSRVNFFIVVPRIELSVKGINCKQRQDVILMRKHKLTELSLFVHFFKLVENDTRQCALIRHATCL